MKIAIGNDRQGLILKQAILVWLRGNGHEVTDIGTNENIPCDYPIFAEKVANLVANGICERGIAICATGIGVSIAANKVAGIRCGIAYNDEVTILMRQHNDANMIAFGQKFMSLESVERRLNLFLNTDYLGGYHQERIELISKIENKQRGKWQ